MVKRRKQETVTPASLPYEVVRRRAITPCPHNVQIRDYFPAVGSVGCVTECQFFAGINSVEKKVFCKHKGRASG